MKTSVGVAVLVLLFAATLSADVCEEVVLFEVTEGAIEVIHDQAPYNCCAWIGFEAYQEGTSIEIVEWEHLGPSGGCDCDCCFDVSVVIGGLDPGEYSVSITKRLEGGESVVLGPWTVTVEGTSDPVLIATYLPCAPASVDDPRETSWGRIKSQYR
ncbi:MAG: hypothetical protein ABIG03_00755 [Candidatus Eisenbacteria bacterium]